MQGPGHGGKLNRKQQLAVLAVMEEPTEERAAARIGISPVTLWRWKQLPEFRQEMQRAQDRVMEEGIRRLRSAGNQAVETLERNLSCGVPSVEVRAASVTLDLVFNVVEVEDLRRRLDALEAGGGVTRSA